MPDLVKEYNITSTFFDRYFEQNAVNRYMVDSLKFMWFKIGKFVNPTKKNEIIKIYIQEEIKDFYENNIIKIPQLEFNITTKCSLKCKDCCALIPDFNQQGHIDLSFQDFKNQLDKITEIASIRHLIILGGEPLLNKDLPEIINYAAKNSSIDLIRITTNGTIVPSKELLDVINQNPNRIYFYLSNYSNNSNLDKLLKYEEIKKVLHDNHIRFQMVDSWNWLEEKGMAETPFSEEITKIKMDKCYRTKCNQILNGKFGICSKALGANELRISNCKDIIDITKSINLREDLIKFFKQEIIDSCRYCIISDNTVQPALQL